MKSFYWTYYIFYSTASQNYIVLKMLHNLATSIMNFHVRCNSLCTVCIFITLGTELNKISLKK